jgi:hypothetical protein
MWGKDVPDPTGRKKEECLGEGPEASTGIASERGGTQIQWAEAGEYPMLLLEE